MCKIIDDNQVDRCWNVDCPFDKAILNGFEVARLNGELETMSGTVARLTEQLVRTEQIGQSYKQHRDKVQQFIQASIDREDWTPEELSEIFWEELAEILDLNLNLFEEKTILLTITQSVDVKVKKGYDLSGYDFDIEVSVSESTDDVEVLDYQGPEVTDWEEM